MEGNIMRAIFALITLVITMNFTACTASDEEPTNNVSNFNAIKTTYGLEETSAGQSNIPSVTVAEMQSVLEAIYAGNDIQSNRISILSENSVESKSKIAMTNQYCTQTRSGISSENFTLSVELKFSKEDGLVYYWGTDYAYSSDLFEWRAGSLSLTSVKGAKYTYEFKSDTYLYFKVIDVEEHVVRVPVIFKGTYDFDSNKGTYNFQLVKK